MTTKRQGFYAQLPAEVIARIRAERKRLKCTVWMAVTSIVAPKVYARLKK